MHTLLDSFKDFAMLETGEQQMFLVGGAVRDILLGKELKDADIVVKGDALQIAQRFSHQTGGTFVLLDEGFGIARVVKNGQSLDISLMRGDSIHSDLAERDLTINAMALPLLHFTESAFLIDPFHGKDDVSSGIIRMVSAENLRKDPLRILRVYRFGATLGFRVEESTRGTAKSLGSLLKSVAVERIVEELRHIFGLPASYPTITEMAKDSVLTAVFPELDGIHPDGLNHMLMSYKRIEEILHDPGPYFSVSGEPLLKYFETDYRNICLKLAALFPDPGIAGGAAARLKMSRREITYISTIADNLLQTAKLFDAYKDDPSFLSTKPATRFFKEIRDDLYPPLIMCAAHAFPIPSREHEMRAFCSALLSKYHGEIRQRMNLLPLINGDDLVRDFQLAPSPRFKKILSTVDDMTLEGAISSKEEALEVVRALLRQGEPRAS